MIINKLTDKRTKSTTFYLVMNKKMIKPTRNANYVKLALNADYEISVDDGKTVLLKDLINADLIPTKFYINNQQIKK